LAAPSACWPTSPIELDLGRIASSIVRAAAAVPSARPHPVQAARGVRAVELEELDGNAIAAMLGIPINTVWTRLHHARKRFQDAMRRRVRRDDHVA
jgi:hypothetical protein